MDAASLPFPAGESAHVLRALRHALADPLSSAVLKLDLVERRLLAPSGADPAWVVERLRAAQANMTAANRLLDLLLRLAEIADERPEATSLFDLCRTAGVPFDEAGARVPGVPARRASSAEAIRNVAAFIRNGDAGGGVPLPIGRASLENGRVILSLQGSRGTDASPERLLDLPHGIEEGETLFVARAAIEADGGRLELTARGGRLAALFSWPHRPLGDGAAEGGA